MDFKKSVFGMYIILIAVFIAMMAGNLYIARINTNAVLMAAVSIGAMVVLTLFFYRFTRKFGDTIKELSDKAASLDILKSVLDSLDIFLYVTDIETDELKFVNQPLMTHLKLTNSVIGQPCWKFFQTGLSERCGYCSLNKLLHDPAMRGKPVIWEGYNTITGRYYRNIDRIIDWPGGQKVHFCQRIDIDEGKQAQEMLLRMSSVVQSSPNYITHQNMTGGCSFVNPAASEITGYSREELMAKDYMEKLFDEKTAYYLRNEILPTIIKEGPVYYEVPIKRKDGEMRIFSAVSFLIASEEKAFGTVATDITEKRRLEDERRGALEKAEQASRAKGDFLSRMSHEMRTPMNVIMGMASLGQKADEIEKMREYLGIINNSANHLLDIINAILDMSKIEAGKTELSKTHFRFGEIIEQITAVINFSVSEKHQTLLVETDQNLPEWVTADKRKLTQIIINLLGNAVKFTPEGGNISLRIHKTEDSGNRCKLLIEVEDDGIGIPEDQQEKIFDAFEQMDNTITRQYEGTGLGLAISKSMVNMMGGEIWVESRPGKGAIFRFTIDVEIETSDKGDTEGQRKLTEENLTGIFAGKRALLADDVPINREILIALLDITGISIDCAENGRQTCDQFAANPGIYDLIFMDIHMPEMDGYEVTRKIRGMDIPEAETVPIIAMTADVFSRDVEKCLAAGMNDHIGKPLEMDVVIAKMREYLH